MIDNVLALLIASIAAVTLALFLVSAAFARRAARLVTALSADMQAIDPERGVPEPVASILRDLALGDVIQVERPDGEQRRYAVVALAVVDERDPGVLAPMSA